MCLIKNKYIKLEMLFSLIYLKKFKSVTVNTASHTTAEMGVFFGAVERQAAYGQWVESPSCTI